MNVNEYLRAIRQARDEFEEEMQAAGMKLMERMRDASSKFVGDFECDPVPKENLIERAR